MKKIIAGGFLALIGMMGISTCYLLAGQSLSTAWSFNRYLSTIFEAGGLGLEFILSAAMLILGLLLIFGNISKKDPD